MTPKTLKIEIRGDWYDINEKGEIKRLDIPGFDFSPTWIFYGASRHHWKNSPDYFLAEAFTNPTDLIGCLLWDVDHGTTRVWGGRYNGKLPRITHASVE